MRLNFDLSNLNYWFRANQLSVNPSKTKYILFLKNKPGANIHLYIENEKLERVNHTKILGLFIDEKLIWEKHMKHCRKNILSGTYARVVL